MYQEILWHLLIQGIQLLQNFRLCPPPHLHLVSLVGPQVPFAQMDPFGPDHRRLQEVLEVQIDQVCRLAPGVPSLQTPPLSRLTCLEVQFFHLRPSGIPDLLGVSDVLGVLVHRADLVHQALHHNPQGPAVQAFLCVRELLVHQERPGVPWVRVGL